MPRQDRTEVVLGNVEVVPAQGAVTQASQRIRMLRGDSQDTLEVGACGIDPQQAVVEQAGLISALSTQVNLFNGWRLIKCVNRK